MKYHFTEGLNFTKFSAQYVKYGIPFQICGALYEKVIMPNFCVDRGEIFICSPCVMNDSSLL